MAGALDDAAMSVDLAAVCVFCGSNRGASVAYEQAARDVEIGRASCRERV